MRGIIYLLLSLCAAKAPDCKDLVGRVLVGAGFDLFLEKDSGNKFLCFSYVSKTKTVGGRMNESAVLDLSALISFISTQALQVLQKGRATAMLSNGTNTTWQYDAGEDEQPFHEFPESKGETFNSVMAPISIVGLVISG